MSVRTGLNMGQLVVSLRWEGMVSRNVVSSGVRNHAITNYRREGGRTAHEILRAGGFEHPAVVYEFESLRVEPVSIRLTATIPDQIRPTDVGFHSAHGCENWQVSDEKLHFEYELDGDAAYRTVCTVKPDAPIDATELITSPDEFTVDPPAEMVRVGAVRQTRRNQQELLLRTPGTTRTRRRTESVPRPAVSRRHRESPSTKRSPCWTRWSANSGRATCRTTRSSTLREEIGDSYQSRSVDVRVKQLQTDISDLRAYMNALEAFFDDHGSAENIIERFEARLDTFETDPEALETTVETQGTNDRDP